jgi:hypothetical protein
MESEECVYKTQTSDTLLDQSQPAPLTPFDLIRQQWTLNHKRYNPAQSVAYNPEHPALATTNTSQIGDIYHALISGKPLKNPIPLDFVTAVLVGNNIDS